MMAQRRRRAETADDGDFLNGRGGFFKERAGAREPFGDDPAGGRHARRGLKSAQERPLAHAGALRKG